MHANGPSPGSLSARSWPWVNMSYSEWYSLWVIFPELWFRMPLPFQPGHLKTPATQYCVQAKVFQISAQGVFGECSFRKFDLPQEGEETTFFCCWFILATASEKPGIKEKPRNLRQHSTGAYIPIPKFNTSKTTTFTWVRFNLTLLYQDGNHHRRPVMSVF